MSEQIMALLITLGIFLLMAAWVPFLELLQHVVRRSRKGRLANSSRGQVLDVAIAEAAKPRRSL
jgi:hypothetical protein